MLVRVNYIISGKALPHFHLAGDEASAVGPPLLGNEGKNVSSANSYSQDFPTKYSRQKTGLCF